MKALTVESFKPYADHTVQEQPSAPMKPGHIRIDVKAAGLNFPDILMVEGKYQIRPPFPFTPGSECAGIITELADDVPHLKVGDRVAAMVQNGAFASEVLAPMMVTWPIGDMPFETAAGMALVYGTSYYGLKQRGQLKDGETLLVLGAAGGVGLAADIRGVFWGTWTMKSPKDHQANMGEILGMYKSGKIKPRISGKYSLEDFAKACDELTQRRAMGKVILTMG